MKLRGLSGFFLLALMGLTVFSLSYNVNAQSARIIGRPPGNWKLMSKSGLILMSTAEGIKIREEQYDRNGIPYISLFPEEQVISFNKKIIIRYDPPVFVPDLGACPEEIFGIVVLNGVHGTATHTVQNVFKAKCEKSKTFSPRDTYSDFVSSELRSKRDGRYSNYVATDEQFGYFLFEENLIDAVIYNVTFEPPAPSEVKFNQKIYYSFRYKLRKHNGILVFPEFFANGIKVRNFANEPSPTYVPFAGKGRRYFYLSPSDYENMIDRIDFQIWTTDQKKLLYTVVIPVRFYFTK